MTSLYRPTACTEESTENVAVSCVSVPLTEKVWLPQPRAPGRAAADVSSVSVTLVPLGNSRRVSEACCCPTATSMVYGFDIGLLAQVG